MATDRNHIYEPIKSTLHDVRKAATEAELDYELRKDAGHRREFLRRLRAAGDAISHEPMVHDELISRANLVSKLTASGSAYAKAKKAAQDAISKWRAADNVSDGDELCLIILEQSRCVRGTLAELVTQRESVEIVVRDSDTPFPGEVLSKLESWWKECRAIEREAAGLKVDECRVFWLLSDDHGINPTQEVLEYQRRLDPSIPLLPSEAETTLMRDCDLKAIQAGAESLQGYVENVAKQPQLAQSLLPSVSAKVSKWLSARDTASVFSIPATRRDAFEKALQRSRQVNKLDDSSWTERTEVGLREARFLYDVNHESVRSLAADYLSE